MIKGIKFEIPNKYDNFISKIISRIPCDTYNWINFEQYDQVFDDNYDFLFQRKCYSGKDFLSVLSKSDYYVVAVKLQAYPSDFNGDISEIKSFDAFEHSNCQLIIRIIDNIYVEIYLKNTHYIQIIYENAVTFDFSNIQFITDDNDMLMV